MSAPGRNSVTVVSDEPLTRPVARWSGQSGGGAMSSTAVVIATGDVYHRYASAPVGQRPLVMGPDARLSRLMLEEQFLALSMDRTGDKYRLEDAAHRSCPLAMLDPLSDIDHRFLNDLYALFVQIWDNPQFAGRIIHHASIASAVGIDTAIEVISSRAPETPTPLPSALARVLGAIE